MTGQPMTYRPGICQSMSVAETLKLDASLYIVEKPKGDGLVFASKMSK